MTRLEALKIHAYHEAAGKITALMAGTIAALCITVGRSLPDTIAIAAAALAFGALMSAISTDMMSKRIPNNLSLLLLLSSPIWWAAQGLGSEIPAGAGTGVVRDTIGVILPGQGTGSILPDFSLSFPWLIALDAAVMLVVFAPLFLSFRYGLGFGGGDVKLITAGSLFFGWPLGFDFLAMTFIVGGVFSIGVIFGRISCRIAMKIGRATPAMIKFSKMREFPYAPAIGIAAIYCFSVKLEGLF